MNKTATSELAARLKKSGVPLTVDPALLEEKFLTRAVRFALNQLGAQYRLNLKRKAA